VNKCNIHDFDDAHNTMGLATYLYYGNTGCGVFTGGIQNYKVFDRDTRRSGPTNFSPKLAINPWKLDL
jgi:hypothetical protein